MKRYGIGGCLLMLITGALSAQPDIIGSRFKQLDTNGDGKLSADEIKAAPANIQRLLKGADKDGDGFLTLDEVREHLGRPAGKPAEPAAAPAQPHPVREGPRVLQPTSVGVGRMVPDLELKQLDGQTVRLKDQVGNNGIVIAMTNTTCPICKRYGPTLAKLETTLAKQGLTVLFVNPTANEKPERMAEFVQTHQLAGPYVHDKEGRFAKQLAASSTAEVFFLDSRRTIVYRGAVDDQYGLGYSLDAPKRNYLLEAIAAHRVGRDVDRAATTAPGCELDLADVKVETSAITYHSRISRIIQANCLECHRDGGVAPFSLETYDDLLAHAGMVRKVVERGTMPPWFATPAAHGQPSHWANDRTVPDEDQEALLSWLKTDRPLGDPADAPLPRTYADGWLIGKPDAIFEFPKPVAVKATGTMPYQNVVIETKLDEDKWVKAVQVRPSARDVVHHVLVFVLTPGTSDEEESRRGDIAAQERQGFFAIYVPGQSVLSYPEGFAKRLPQGSRLMFQMHYTPNGTATQDSTQIGLIYSDKEPEFEVKVAGLVNARLSIPPGADNHPESASLRVPIQATLLGFLPHMHLRGKSFRYELTPPGGETEVLLDIPHYDFNWQLYYRLAEPRPLQLGTVIKATGWFDNSENNPANPDPKRTVRWGPQTTDEMMLGYLEYYVPAGSDAKVSQNVLGNLINPGTLFKRLDKNGDGKVSREEFESFVKILPRFRNQPDQVKALFDRLDTNNDGYLTMAEFEKLSEN